MLSKKFWKYTTIVFVALLIISLYYNPLHKDDSLSEERISLLAENFIGSYLLGQTSHSVKIDSVIDEGNIYRVGIHIDGKEGEVFFSKDGQFFFPQALDIETAKQASKFNKVVDVNVRNDPVIGMATAPATMIELSDYQCGYCAKFALNTFKQIKESYIDTGKVKFIHKNFPLERIHQLSFKAAEAAECAYKQDRFWDYHHELFANMHDLEVDDLKKYAEDLDLNMAEFNSCLDSGEMKEEVRADMKDGDDAGVSGTPAFFVNGRFITGAQTYGVFAQIIEEELGKATL